MGFQLTRLRTCAKQEKKILIPGNLVAHLFIQAENLMSFLFAV
jgi:hypothetical protein